MAPPTQKICSRFPIPFGQSGQIPNVNRKRFFEFFKSIGNLWSLEGSQFYP